MRLLLMPHTFLLRNLYNLRQISGYFDCGTFQLDKFCKFLACFDRCIVLQDRRYMMFECLNFGTDLPSKFCTPPLRFHFDRRPLFTDISLLSVATPTIIPFSCLLGTCLPLRLYITDTYLFCNIFHCEWT